MFEQIELIQDLYSRQKAKSLTITYLTIATLSLISGVFMLLANTTNHLVGYITISYSFIMLFLIWYFLKNGNLKAFEHQISLMGVLYMVYFLTTGGYYNTALTWGLLFPVFSYYTIRYTISLLYNFSLMLLFLAILVLQKQFEVIPHLYTTTEAIHFILVFLLINFFAYSVEYSRRKAFEKNQQLLIELSQKSEEVEYLKHLIPICSHCKRVRDDDGFWNQVETFFKEHASLEFSHSICPDCAEKYYSDVIDK